MKIKLGSFVKVLDGNPLNIYEVIGLRSYNNKEVEVLAVIWGINNSESGVIDINHLKSTTPYWTKDEKLPFDSIKEYDNTPTSNKEVMA